MIRQMNSQAQDVSNASRIFVTEVNAGSGRPQTAAGPQLEIPNGEVLADRYTVRRQLGTGGFGAVYLVEDAQLQQELALKVVLADPGAAEGAFEELVHEFKLRNQISDFAHIIRSYDPRSCEYRGLRLVLLPMDLADGGSLRHWMEANGNTETRQEAAMALFSQACFGVKAIHDAGLAHLDIKPENILLVNGKAKVTDFGIGRYVGGQIAANPEQLLRQGVGTAQYMSPEQFQAARQAEIGPASDIYSLGLLLYELLDGAPPFDGAWNELREKHLNMRPPELKGRAAAWRPIVERCLAKEPHRRYPGVQQLLHDLERAAAGDAVSADAACPQCGHLNANESNRYCERCGADLSSCFRECVKCGRHNRLDVDRCSGCGFEIAAHYLFEQRSMRVAKLKDENPIEAIELLELMVRSGAGEKEAAMAKDLRQKQGKIGPWMTQARERLLAGQPEEAVGLWRDILRLVPRHRAALAEVERLECLIAQCLALRDQAAEAMNEARFDDAQVRLQKCLELIPQHPEVATQLAGARERAIQYASLRTDVSAARKEKKLRLALDLAARLLSLAPRSPEALSESQDIHELLEQTEGLIADGKKRLARAQFVEAQETIRKVELLQADHPDVAELTRSLARSRTEYDQAMAEAEQARENRDLDRAANALRQAHDLCPACSRVNDLLKAVCEGQQRACDLLRAVEDAINAAQFEVGERHLKEAEDIHPRVRGAAEARQRLAATRCEYDQYMQRGQQAMAGRDLNVALDSSQKALVLCPGSERARNLFEQVQGDQAAARRHLQGIRALCEAAEFDAAAKKVSAARALWSTLEGVDDSEAEMLSRRRAYQQEMEKIHRLRGGKKLQEAFEACAVALKVCPKSREVESLRDAILQEGRCEAERQAHRSRQWAGRRRLLLRLTKALVLIAAVLAVLAALGVGGMHLWRGLCAMAGRGVHAVQGSDVHMMALRWCPQQIFIVGIVDWVLLCVVARIHKARYTNLYHHIFQGLFNGARDQQMRAAGVVALWLAIVCGGTPAAIAWLCVHYEKFTFGQAASFTVLGTGVLAFLALILALVRRCRWRLA